MLRSLSLLESLDLSSNQLTGEIPPQVTSITFLAVLNLSQKHLVSLEAHSLKHLKAIHTIYGNSRLCGFPLLENCGDNETSQPPLPWVSQQKDDSDILSGFTWKVVLLGYGCGTVFGLVTGADVEDMEKQKGLIKYVQESVQYYSIMNIFCEPNINEDTLPMTEEYYSIYSPNDRRVKGEKPNPGVLNAAINIFINWYRNGLSMSLYKDMESSKEQVFMVNFLVINCLMGRR
ncbi:hypothetical protein LguiB_029401 [Lonicera macranthoides]